MARRTGLREFQLSVAERLRTASTRTALSSKLGFQVGADNWFVALHQVSEVIPVPATVGVPLTHSWFRGVANVRGNLYSVTDFSAFLGGEPTAAGEQARLLLINERFRSGAALLVDRSLGLRDPGELEPRGDAGASQPPFVRAVFADGQGKLWKELDVAALIQDQGFLEASL